MKNPRLRRGIFIIKDGKRYCIAKTGTDSGLCKSLVGVGREVVSASEGCAGGDGAGDCWSE